MPKLKLPTSMLVAAGLISGAALPVEAQVTRIQRNPSSLILDAAKVGGGTDMIFVSGQLPSPIDPAMPISEVKAIEDLGDTKTQTISTLGKISSILEEQGYAMSDVVKLTLFVVADPRLGHMDFAGVNEGFRQFFGSAENPATVARSTLEVAGLVGPHYLIEIEAIAAKHSGS